jgi:hypothetical protein
LHPLRGPPHIALMPTISTYAGDLEKLCQFFLERRALVLKVFIDIIHRTFPFGESSQYNGAACRGPFPAGGRRLLSCEE